MDLRDSKNIKFGLEINSIYDAAFWGLETILDFIDFDLMKPDRFWGIAMEKLAELGFAGFEMTFGPGSKQGALMVYKTPEYFRRELKAHGLEVASGFYSGLFDDKPCSADHTGKWRIASRQKEMLREVQEYLEFLAEAGCSWMTIGLPMRGQWNAEEPCFIDADYYRELADIVNRMGYMAAKTGLRLAMHPESNSSFWLPRDIGMLLGFTDPVYVDFCPDTAHIRAGGTEPAELVKQYAERVSIFHWKDCLGKVPTTLSTEGIIFLNHAHYFTTVGRGTVDGIAWIEMLRDIHYKGWAIMEIPASPHFKEIEFATGYLREKILPIYN